MALRQKAGAPAPIVAGFPPSTTPDPGNQMEYDVFLSHRSSNKPWVETLRLRLWTQPGADMGWIPWHPAPCCVLCIGTTCSSATAWTTKKWLGAARRSNRRRGRWEMADSPVTFLRVVFKPTHCQGSGGKIPALDAEQFFQERAARGDRERFGEMMDNVSDHPVQAEDERT